VLEQRFGPLTPGFLRRRLMLFEEAVEAAVARLAAELPPQARVLDAGAGEGRHAALFSHCRYTGVDAAIGDPAWDYSRLDALADLTQLPFPDGCFDAILNIVVLEHTREPARVVAELARTLKPKGRLLLVAPHSWEVHQSPHDYFRFTRHGLAWLFSQAGLNNAGIRPVGGYFTLLARRMMNSLNFFQGGARWAAFPFVAAVAVPCAAALPWLDFLDREKNFTLAYLCLAEKT